MSKIAIISQPDQGVLIDVSGCTTLKEALEHLSSTLQVSNQFWKGMHVSINLGALSVNKDELGNILAIAKGVGITPTGVYSTSDETREALRKSSVPLGAGKPMTLPAVSIDPSKITSTELDDEKQKAGPLASITMRVVDAVKGRGGAKEHAAAPPANELEEMRHEAFEEKPTEESHFPHVKPKRKVSLDGRKIDVTSEPRAPKAAPKPDVAAEAPKAPKPEVKVEKTDDKVIAAESVVTAETIIAAEVVSPDDKQFAPTVEMKIPPSPQVEVRVMSIQVADGMIEAQPAQQAIAQAATVSGDIVTQVDADCNLNDDDVIEDEDIESAEEYIEEEVDTDDVALAARGGPTTLYLRQNLRSGQTVSHKGHLVIIGDINPGAEVMADGDITVWGCLRGVAHAGIGGNVNAEIRALKLQPIQIRIAHAIARAPDRPRVNYATNNGPETARMVDGKIKVVRSRIE